MTEDVFGLLGQVVAGQYRVVRVRGEGSFGVVYEGEQQGLGRRVAIKYLKVPPHFTAEARQKFLARFEAEGGRWRSSGTTRRW